MASTFLHCAPTTAATFLTIGVPDIDDDDVGDDGGDGGGDGGDDGDDGGDDRDGDVDEDAGFNFFLTVAHSCCHFFSPEVLPAVEMRSR